MGLPLTIRGSGQRMTNSLVSSLSAGVICRQRIYLGRGRFPRR